MDQFWMAVSTLLGPEGLVLAVIGFLIGCFGGAMIGIGGALTTALVIPFTLSMSPENAMIILIGIYSGTSYAGSIPSILINTPGGPSAAAVALDGYAMARKGEASTAIAISATASAVGALVGGFALIAALPFLNYIAKAFGSQEFLMFGVFGLASIVAASDAGLIKGFIAGILGALLATVGASLLDANPRFTFGIAELTDGIDLVAAMIGLFAFSEMVRMSKHTSSIAGRLIGQGNWLRGVLEACKEWKAVLRGSGIGIVVGLVPGEGGTVATFMSYITEKQWAKNPELFGHGHPAGIAGPEAANNSVIGGALVPTLALGIPGSVATALLLTALMLQGIRPGPTLFTSDAHILYAIIGSILLGGVLTMIVGLAAARPLALLTVIPMPILIPVVCVLSVIGIYASNFNYGHIYVALAAGIVGYAFDRLKYPIVAFLLGFIVGPLAEENFMRTYQLTQGRMWEIFERPLCAAMLIVTLLVLTRPLVKAVRHTKERAPV
jgi:putative tricarboxylic transport membrane protein